MSKYAFVQNNQIIDFRDIDDNLYQMWISTNNPKSKVYLPIVEDAYPTPNQYQAIDVNYIVEQNRVIKLYVLRNKTPEEMRKVWTAYEFLTRFTQQERATLRAAAATDPLVADFSQLLGAAQEIVSDDPVTIQAMDYLVYAGYITNDRRSVIMDLPTT
jgi:hypothetical protein